MPWTAELLHRAQKRSRGCVAWTRVSSAAGVISKVRGYTAVAPFWELPVFRLSHKQYANVVRDC